MVWPYRPRLIAAMKWRGLIAIARGLRPAPWWAGSQTTPEALPDRGRNTGTAATAVVPRVIAPTPQTP